MPGPGRKSMERVSITGLVLAVGILAANPSAGVGQVASIVPGNRVRLTAPSLGLRDAVGTVQEATDTSLVVQFDYPARLGTVDRAEIAAMDVSIRQETKIRKSAGVGFLIGAGSGVLIGLASGDDEPGWFSFTAEEKAAMIGVGLGLTGGVVGLVIGLVNRHDVWSSALPENVALNVLPLVREGGPGVHIGLALRFN
jgi:hypothetical protein